MKFSVGIEYALHCLLYMVDLKENKSIRVRDFAEFQGISESYLSKTFTQLSKAGIVLSSPGIKGGYRLAKSPQSISFWDVVEAIEGKDPLFQCHEVRFNNPTLKKIGVLQKADKSPCLISGVMHQGEEEMKKFLSKKTLRWLHDEVFNHAFTREQQKLTIQWLAHHSW